MTAATEYTAQVDAVTAQRARILGIQPGSDAYAGALGQRFRVDPRQALDADLSVIASYLTPGDTLLDVGGGAGRLSLPLALRCRQLINVDPSTGMRTQFEAAAVEAGIANARFVQTDWLAADGIEADVSLVAHVTYFVRDIVPFLQKLAAATRRRVLLLVASVPPPNQTAPFFHLVYGENQALLPGHRELLAVLWDMGLLPDVRVLPGPSAAPYRTPVPARAAAIEEALGSMRLPPADRERARAVIDGRFDELYVSTPGGFVRRPAYHSRELLITWTTSRTPHSAHRDIQSFTGRFVGLEGRAATV
jgi:2-polyprenyl-3-methyl-5-hydroxy-6-metoxy-1,4-benzoquinol methylase